MKKNAVGRLLDKHPKLNRFVKMRYIQLRDVGYARRQIQKYGCYMNRKYCVLNDRKLIYISNCKVASSSIKASMQGLQGLENYHQVNDALRGSDAYVSNIDLNKYADYYKFSFVRNPFARLLSCYENKLHDGCDAQGLKGAALYEGRLHFDHFLLGYLRKDRGFKRFARRVCRVPDKLSERHIVSQYYLLHDQNGQPLYDFVGKMEHLADEYEPIRVKYGLDPLPRYNATKKRNWMDAYDEKTAHMVAKRYARDIEVFGYQDVRDKLFEYVKGKR